MDDPPTQPRGGEAPSAPAKSTELLAAIRSLTAWGTEDGPRVGRSALFYPFVGVGLGTLYLAADRAAASFAGLGGRSLAVVLVSALFTGGRGWIGFGRAAIALLDADHERAVATLRGTARQAPVRIATAGCAVAQFLCLCGLDRFRTAALLFAPLLGACSMVVLAVGSRQLRADGRRMKYAPALTFNEFAVASSVSFAIVFLSAEFLGLLLVLATAALTVGLRVLLHWRLDGVDDSSLQAGRALVELQTLFILALL
jgi:hypothetical protein